MMKTIGLYIRVSTTRQALEGYSLGGQRDEGIAKAHQMFGTNINIKCYVDEGISAKSTIGRAELTRMMQDVRRGRLHAIITYKVSRLSRNLSDSLSLVEEIDNANVAFISIKEGQYGTPHANLQFNILSSVAQYQREELAENVKMGMTKRAEEGYHNGGICLGYTTVNKLLQIVPDEAEIIKIIFDKYLNEGWGTKKIACYLNQIGMKTKKNNSFAQSTVNNIIRNPIYKGYVRFNQVQDWEKKRRKGKNPDYIVNKGFHEAIIDEETWDKVNEMLKKRSKGAPRQYTGTFPLTSLTKCPECGSYMTSMYGGKKKDGSKYRYYVCGKYHNHGRSMCNPNSVNATKLEKAVFERLAEALQSDSMIESITNNINYQINQKFGENSNQYQIEKIKKTIEAKRKSIQKAQTEFLKDSSICTPDEAAIIINNLRSEINALEDSLQEISIRYKNQDARIKHIDQEMVRTQLKEFLELKDQLDVLEFRQLLAASIESIEVDKEDRLLKDINFSFIASLPESENLRDSSLHNTISKNSPILLQALYFRENHHLFVVRFGHNDPYLFEIPESYIKEVRITHPENQSFNELGLRWYAVPIISEMKLEIGGIDYPAAPFNGWYMETEIAARNFTDENRYNMLRATADAFGLNTQLQSTMWKDRAVIELCTAVMHSFKKAGASIVDHHTASQQFELFEQRESDEGREITGDWTWLIPPVSPASSYVFHKEYDNTWKSPNFFYQDSLLNRPESEMLTCPFTGSRP